jgi:MFS family permease
MSTLEPAADLPLASSPTALDASTLPSLYQDKSFWGMTVTQFFGAFNDNLFKQLILLLAVNLAAKEVGAEAGPNRQGLAMLVFSAPFVLFATFSGFVADRFSKRNIIVSAKVAEIFIMFLGMLGFMYFDVTGFTGLCVVLFLMGLHSTFFAPAKYGILPEMLRDTDLPQANGVFLMTTFMAIIFGMASAGWLSTWLAGKVWIASFVCIGIAVLGSCTSLLVRKVPPANPNLKLDSGAIGIPKEMRSLLANDRLLVSTLIVCSMFWLLGGIVQPTVNEFGIQQLKLGDTKTSYLQAAMGIGIAIGCLIGGFLSKDRVRFSLTRLGAFGMVACAVVLGLPGSDPAKSHLLGYGGSIPLLVALGAFAGIFVVPLQVFIQSRPPEDQKGRMVAFMNLCTWIGIIISAVLVIAIDWLQHQMGWPKASAFFFIAALMAPIPLLFRAKDQALSTR